jgi:enamine deaminase RidA (YjgF/YER057c/UK114 family)
MAAQLDLALSNLEAVLAGADMTIANVVRLNVYTTDVDGLLEHFAKLSDRLVDAGGFASTLLGVPHPCVPATVGRDRSDRGRLTDAVAVTRTVGLCR